MRHKVAFFVFLSIFILFYSLFLMIVSFLFLYFMALMLSRCLDKDFFVSMMK